MNGHRLFLRLEGGESVVCEDVIGVFDMENATTEAATREFLKKSQRELQVVSLASDLPRSFVVVREAYGSRVYISGLSSETIVRRMTDPVEKNEG